MEFFEERVEPKKTTWALPSLRQAREKADISLRKMAASLDISATHLSHIETGKTKVSKMLVKRLQTALTA